MPSNVALERTAGMRRLIGHDVGRFPRGRSAPGRWADAIMLGARAVASSAMLFTAVACGASAGTSANTAASRPPNERPDAQPRSTRSSSPSVPFRPASTTLHLSLGDFGPCQVEHDPQTHVSTVFCDKSDAAGQEGLLFNFYLPGVWSAPPFTPEDVARQLRDSSRPGTFVEGFFSAPDAPGSEPAFHIVTTAVYPDDHAGQAFIIKVARVGPAVYSRIYSRMFVGPSEDLRGPMRAWLARNLEKYSAELERLRVDEAWVRQLSAAP